MKSQHFENKIVKEKINKSITKLCSMNESGDNEIIDINAEMAGFIEAYESYLTEFPEALQSWFIERTSEVKLNKGNIFSIDYIDYSFTGGAHPNSLVIFKSITFII